MKRTSLMLDDSLLKQVRALARKNETTLTEAFHLLLREGLSSVSAKNKPDYKFSIPIVKGSAPPRANVADRKELYDFMEESE